MTATCLNTNGMRAVFMICCCASFSIELHGRKTTACSPMRSISVVVSGLGSGRHVRHDVPNRLHSKGFLSKSSTTEDTEDAEDMNQRDSDVTLDVVGLRSRPSGCRGYAARRRAHLQALRT